jgi:hypothetical protein
LCLSVEWDEAEVLPRKFHVQIAEDNDFAAVMTNQNLLDFEIFSTASIDEFDARETNREMIDRGI